MRDGDSGRPAGFGMLPDASPGRPSQTSRQGLPANNCFKFDGSDASRKLCYVDPKIIDALSPDTVFIAAGF